MNYKFYKIIIYFLFLYFTKYYFIFEPVLVGLYYLPPLHNTTFKMVPLDGKYQPLCK